MLGRFTSRMKIKRHLPLAITATVFVIALAAIPLHSYWRSQQPAVSESRGMVVCRMKYCDFRFPLPPGAHIVSIGPLTVGPDTITGIIVHNGATGTATYDAVLRQHGFDFKPGSLMATSSEQPGGWVQPVGGQINFSYFGDR
jgi:hypothetical protein